jgi:hypothetical protein
MSKQRDPAKERFWRRMIRQWRRSGLSAREFCASQGIREASLYGWRRILAQRDAQATRFVPVRVIPGAADDERAAATVPGATADASAAASGLELIVGGGRRLRIGPGFDEATLVRLLAILQEGRPCS